MLLPLKPPRVVFTRRRASDAVSPLRHNQESSSVELSNQILHLPGPCSDSCRKVVDVRIPGLVDGYEDILRVITQRGVGHGNGLTGKRAVRVCI